MQGTLAETTVTQSRWRTQQITQTQERCRCCYQIRDSSTLHDHPLGRRIGMPKNCMCTICMKIYQAGRWEWKLNAAGKDEFCRICGEGNLGTVSCDNEKCTFSFCEGCVIANCGKGRYEHILQLAENSEWHCFACSISAAEKVHERGYGSAKNSPNKVSRRTIGASSTASVASDATILPVAHHNHIRRHLALAARASLGGFTKRTIFDPFALCATVVEGLTYSDERMQQRQRMVEQRGNNGNNKSSWMEEEDVDEDRELNDTGFASSISPLTNHDPSHPSSPHRHSTSPSASTAQRRAHLQNAQSHMRPPGRTSPFTTRTISPLAIPTRSKYVDPSKGKKILSFSFFLHELHTASAHTPYVYGLLENIRRIYHTWWKDGWVMRLYYDDSFLLPNPVEILGMQHIPRDGIVCKYGYHQSLRNTWYTVLQPLMSLLGHMGMIELVRFNWPHFQDKERIHHGSIGCFARFLPLAELAPGIVERVVVVDVDNHLTPRAKAYAECMIHTTQRFHDPRYTVPVWAGGFAVRVPDDVMAAHGNASAASSSSSRSSSSAQTWSNPFLHIERELHSWCTDHCRSPLSILERPEMPRGRTASELHTGGHHCSKTEHPSARMDHARAKEQRKREEEDRERGEDRQRGKGAAIEEIGSPKQKERIQPKRGRSTTPALSPPNSSNKNGRVMPFSSSAPEPTRDRTDHKEAVRPASALPARIDAKKKSVWDEEDGKDAGSKSAPPLRQDGEGADNQRRPVLSITAPTPSPPEEPSDDECVEISPPRKSNNAAPTTPTASSKGKNTPRVSAPQVAARRGRPSNGTTTTSASNPSSAKTKRTTLFTHVKRASTRVKQEPTVAVTDVSLTPQNLDDSTVGDGNIDDDELSIDPEESMLEFFPYGSDQIFLADCVWPKMQALGCETIYVALPTTQLSRTQKVWPPVLTGDDKCRLENAPAYWSFMDWMPNARRPRPEQIEGFVKTFIATRWKDMLVEASISPFAQSQRPHTRWIEHGEFQRSILSGERSIKTPLKPHAQALQTLLEQQLARATAAGGAGAPKGTSAGKKRTRERDNPNVSTTVALDIAPEADRPTKKTKRASITAASPSSSTKPPARTLPSRSAKRALNLAELDDADEEEMGGAEITPTEELVEEDSTKTPTPKRGAGRRGRFKLEVPSTPRLTAPSPILSDIAADEVGDSGIREWNGEEDDSTAEMDEENEPLFIEQAPPTKQAPRSTSAKRQDHFVSEPSREPARKKIKTESAAVPKHVRTKKPSSAASSEPKAAVSCSSSSIPLSSHSHFLDECEWGCINLHDARDCQERCEHKDAFNLTDEPNFRVTRAQASANNKVNTIEDVDMTSPSTTVAAASTHEVIDIHAMEVDHIGKVSTCLQGPSSLSPPSTSLFRSSRTKKVPKPFSDFVANSSLGLAAASHGHHPKQRVHCTCACEFCRPGIMRLRGTTLDRPILHPFLPNTAWPWNLEQTQGWLCSFANDAFIALALYLEEARLPRGSKNDTTGGYRQIEQLINTHPTMLLKLLTRAISTFGGSECMPTLLAFSLYQKLKTLRRQITEIAARA